MCTGLDKFVSLQRKWDMLALGCRCLQSIQKTKQNKKTDLCCLCGENTDLRNLTLTTVFTHSGSFRMNKLGHAWVALNDCLVPLAWQTVQETGKKPNWPRQCWRTMKSRRTFDFVRCRVALALKEFLHEAPRKETWFDYKIKHTCLFVCGEAIVCRDTECIVVV